MEDCFFCKIVKGENPSKRQFEDESVLVIEDVNPKAPIHLLIIPKIHVSDLTQDTNNYWSKIGEVAKHLAKEKGLKGFRLVHNAGTSAGVPHMHVHLLGDVAATREV
ncbi:hypothetical protein A3E15_00850 [Candidatus Woesebacteria bacterium RIFCSPHIGHO2_12_FULL_42_9]|uniref:HIT domain-containing protein n=3 Tax=Candidatus Woeseibacteriota TaxID=1752722 RepID=A0A1F8APS9_9BACT|nr:MAG: hypothetical protein A2112_02680 [Candidatus Woesebacteria bacterium GWA1_42_12]OGM06343.1 MAG: hypothetical protein A2129_02815 [Candidatus Woesebacteria bacterium GWC1_42_13]OGM53766.1 MAG: hypothetical protein A3E15_00850 [Candidatus Woesebacteria bacterium RIFCSPHIGHO2_12_FULL_42_9]